MTFDYSRFVATAVRLIAKYGISAKIVRKGVVDDTTYPATLGADTEHDCTLVWYPYTAMDRSSDTVTEQDVRAIVSPNAGTVPKVGDRLKEGSAEFYVVNVQTLRPGGVTVLYECQCRASNA